MHPDPTRVEPDAAAVSTVTRRRPPARRVVMVVLLLLLGGAIGTLTTWLSLRPSGGQGRAAGSETRSLYQCPMHPTITADRPGDCPICGMKLVEVNAAPDARASAERRILFYRSPMNPDQTSPTPRKDEMGMDYLPVYEDDSHDAGPGVDGLAAVTIDPARQQLIGLRTAPVVAGAVGGSWRTVGRVQVDPTRVRKVNIKVEGYVERLHVDFVGRPVRRGQPLFSLYSPSLLAAENEYVLALETRDALEAAGATGDDGTALVEAARRKLQLWDLPAGEIRQLETTRTPSRVRTFVSPVHGVVTAKNVVEGARLSAGDTPFEITDLSEVWVMADGYESDLARVQVGMGATLTLKSHPNRSFRGRVAFIDPVLDPATRTAKIHIHLRNPAGELKPEMYGEVVLEGLPRNGLRIPTDAVIRSGTMDVVFLALEDGRFLPRQVQLGARSEREVEVTSGLDAGQRVVTRANFLVDSESQLRSSLAAMAETRP